MGNKGRSRRRQAGALKAMKPVNTRFRKAVDYRIYSWENTYMRHDYTVSKNFGKMAKHMTAQISRASLTHLTLSRPLGSNRI